MFAPDSEPTLLRLLVEATRQVEAVVLGRLAERGRSVTRAQLDLVRHLDPEGTRVSELARRLAVSRQSVMEAAVSLARSGLVEVGVDPGDRRARLVRPTQSAEAALADFAGLLRDLEAGLLAAGVEVEGLRRQLAAVRDALAG
jgi:DNA-binding MarR family transcriptional regulator